MATVYLGKSDAQFWGETSPRMLISQLQEYSRIETDRAILQAIAYKLDDPTKLRKKEQTPISNDQAWDNWGR